MHALRLSSFMNRPTLLSVQTLLIMGLYLINMGKFLESYTIFGITIRVSQALGCKLSEATVVYYLPAPKLADRYTNS